MRPRTIPSYFIYGEPERRLDVGFLHVETVQARHSVHRGTVEPHRHEHMGQITLWTAGGGTYRIEGQTWPFQAPAVSFVPSGVVHGFAIAPGADAIVVSIADGLLSSLTGAQGGLPYGPVFVRDTLQQETWSDLAVAVQTIAREYRSLLPGRDACLKLLIALALTYIGRLSSAAANRDTQAGTIDLALAFRRLVDQHFRDNLPIKDYTRRLGSTHHLLERAVRQAHGCSIKSAISARRLVEAQRLLLFTNRSAESIAYELGFKDPGYFSRVFRAQTGAAPGQWRQRQTAKST